jgi:serine/threonine-protein kinase
MAPADPRKPRASPGDRDEADRLLEAAGRIADGADVDWASLERELPAERGAVDALRRLASLSVAREGDPPGEGHADDAPAWRWGHLEVRERVGEGAFGEVWRAFDPVLRRDVALKLRRDDSGGTGAEARVFLEEARHLARVRHPGVLGVHGADVHDNRVGLWTDLVAGRTLQEALAANGPFPAPRVLDVGLALAEALSAVHRAGLVHGDVKAANVMLEHDTDRVVLMDFGAAGPQSRSGRFGSPLSMAPEVLAGGDPTPKADLYSLGVLLYFLLAGRLPVEANDLEDLARSHRTPLAESRARRLRAPWAVRRFVARLLAADPSRRPDARGAADAIRSIQEAPARRGHRLAVAGVIASLAIGAALAGLGYVRARQEARRAEAARDFLASLFGGIDPDAARGRSVTAKELLDRGAERLDAELARQPELHAEMLGVVGRLYQRLGVYDRARPLLERALAIRTRLEGTSGPIRAESAGDLAALLHDQGEFEAAEGLAREALGARRAQGVRRPAALAQALAALGAIVSNRGNPAEADALYREAIAIDRRLGDRAALADHLGGHGTALWRAARYDEARQAHEEALANQRLLGGESTAVATSLLALGTDLMELGRFAEAEALFEECLALRRRLLGDTHPHVAFAYGTLGDLHQRSGRLEQAEQAHREAFRILTIALGPDHPETANSLNHVAVVLYFRARYREAVAIFRQILPQWRAAYGPHHPNVFMLLNNLGASLREAGDRAEAEEVLRETLALRREAFGDDHPEVAQSYNNLASLLAQTGADEEAEACFRQAIATWRQALGSEHPTLSYGLVELGKFLVERRRYAEAEPLLREGESIRAAALDARAPLLASARLYLAESLLGLRRAGEARALIELAQPVIVERWGPDHEVSRRAQRAASRAGAARDGPGALVR